MSTVTTIAGFSVVNRCLLYAGVLLAPAQFLSGLGNNCPSNIGFLAFNWYSQLHWYHAVKSQNLHALCLVLPHFTTIYTLSYLGGISSGNIYMGIFLGLGTVGVMILNDVASWTSWVTNMPDGYGVYEFFFFGWRTLNSDWHKFFLVWTIFDTIVVFSMLFVVLWASAVIPSIEGTEKMWWYRYPAIPLGAVAAAVALWPLILWTELLVARNHIESATDWISIWIFIAQAVMMLLPDCGLFNTRKQNKLSKSTNVASSV